MHLMAGAQAIRSKSSVIKLNQITVADGLSDNTVRNIYQSPDGFLWLSTLNGLDRFDGYTFCPSGAPFDDRHVKKVAADRFGHLWVESSSGHWGCLDIKNGKFIDYYDGPLPPRASYRIEDFNGATWLWHPDSGAVRISVRRNEGLSYLDLRKVFTDAFHSRITSVITAFDGALWASTEHGIKRFDRNRVSTYLPHISFAAVIPDSAVTWAVATDGKIYALDITARQCRQTANCNGNVNDFNNIYRNTSSIYISSRNGIFRFDLASRKLIPEPKLPAGARFFTDNADNGWAGNGKGTLYRIDFNTDSISSFKVMPQEKIKNIGYERYSVYDDCTGNIWIATYGHGLLTFTSDGRLLKRFSSDGKPAAPSDFILCVTGDRDGTIWAGTEHAGIFSLWQDRLDCKPYYPAGKSQHTRANSFRRVCQRSDGTVMAANRQGALYSLDGVHDLPGEAPKLFSKNVMSVLEDLNGSIWYGLRGDGIQVSDISSPSQLPSTGYDIFDMLQDKKGRIWAAMFDKGLGLICTNESGYAFTPIDKSAGVGTEWRSLAIDLNGYIWGATGNGLRIFHPDSVAASGNAAIHVINTTHGLPCNEIRVVMAARDGRIWMTLLGAGIAVAEGPYYGKVPVFHHISSTDGLVNNLTQSITEDLDGNIWVGTESGLSKIDTHTGDIDSFFPGDDDSSNMCLENSATCLADGTLIFGTDYGLLTLRPESSTPADSTMRATLTSYELSDDGHLKASFSSFNLNSDIPALYSVYLDGYDSAWSIPSTANRIEFYGLKPGRYVLKVKARNPHKLWSPESELLSFEIPSNHSNAILCSVILLFVAAIISLLLFKKLHKTLVGVSPTDSPVTQQSDDKTARILATVIDRQLNNPDCSVENLAADMNMSRTALYNFIKSQTGMAPMEYLRTQRLERGAMLLLDENMNVSEVSAAVGMRDPLYFSRCFKKRYGLSPTAYIKASNSGHKPEV